MGNPRRTNSSRRNKVVARVKAEESDCWLCGLPVDKTLPPRLPTSPEVHEVIPVSRGGDPYDRANCHLTHRLCNQRQGNRLPGEDRPTTRADTRTITTDRSW